MPLIRLAFSVRVTSLTMCAALTVFLTLGIFVLPHAWGWIAAPLVVAAGLTTLGLHDLLQTKRSMLRNYPIASHVRLVMEDSRTKIMQYFFKGEKDGRPFARDKRSLVY